MDQLAGNAVVNFCSGLQFDGIANHDFRASLGQPQPASRLWHSNGNTDGSLYLTMLLFDSVPIVGIDFLNRTQNALFRHFKVTFRSQSERDFMPYKTCTGNL